MNRSFSGVDDTVKFGKKKFDAVSSLHDNTYLPVKQATRKHYLLRSVPAGLLPEQTERKKLLTSLSSLPFGVPDHLVESGANPD